MKSNPLNAILWNAIPLNLMDTIDIDTPNINNQQHRLNKISEMEDYFIATAIRAPIRITSASLSLAFSWCTGLVKSY